MKKGPPANRRPTIQLGTPSKTKGVASDANPFEVSIPVTTADQDGTVDRVVVDWGDGEPETYDDVPASVQHTYTEGGGYAVSVTAIDDDQASSGAQVQLTVVDDVVFTGSYNLSRSGERNAENVLEIEDAALAERLAGYVDEIRALYPRFEPRDGVASG